jgi:hypothetical protein
LWERKGILAFYLAFPLEYEKQAKKNQNISFLFLAIHLAFPLQVHKLTRWIKPDLITLAYQ